MTENAEKIPQQAVEYAGPGATPSQVAAGRKGTRNIGKVLIRQPQLLFGSTILLLFVVLALGAPAFAPTRYDEGDPAAAWQRPSSEHLLGTDSLGRDVLSRLIYGSRVSLAVGLGSMVVALLLGVTVGAISGYFARKVDLIVMRVIDVVLAFPSLLFVLLLSVVFGGGVSSIILAVGLTRWAPLARIVRAEFLRVRNLDYVQAATALGARPGRIVVRHIFPNTLAPVIVFVTFGIPFAVIAEAALGFIGLGVSPPVPSWGVMLREGFSAFRSFPNLVLAPSVALSFTMLAFVAFGNGLQDLLDPRLRQ